MNTTIAKRAFFIAGLLYCLVSACATAQSPPDSVHRLEPAEQGFYSKALDCNGVAIKAHSVVDDQALILICGKLRQMLENQPVVLQNLSEVHAELHVAGRDQPLSDLPEYRSLKDVPFDHGMTLDQRARGLGGLITSCSEENLLYNDQDPRYRGRDICAHEIAHMIQLCGLSADIRDLITDQYYRSLSERKWRESYAATNPQEYFAELTMWYFGTHGDKGMRGPKPADGPVGLKRYDQAAYALLNQIYKGKIKASHVPKIASLPLSDLATLRPETAGSAVNMVFVNTTDRPYTIFWIDFNGQPISYGVLGAHAGKLQATFSSHVWLVGIDEDHPVSIFQAPDIDSVAVVSGH